MAHPDEIANLPSHLQKVAGEIGALIDSGTPANNEMLPAFEGPAAGAASPPELDGALAIWRLNPNAYGELENSTLRGDIADWAMPTRLLHHQILINGKPAGFARSLLPPKNDKSLAHFSVSPLATQIQEALDQLEEQNGNYDDGAADPIVRLLEIPAYHVLALWLYYGRGRESQVVIINAANRFQRLKRNSRLSSTQFFEDLAKGGPILGVA